MPLKHQGKCYRNFGGALFMNQCDLIYGEEECTRVIAEVKAEAKLKGKRVRKIKHPEGHYQLFVEV